MKDKYGRTIDYLRISLTDRCNLRCVYCMPEEGIRQIPHEEILTYDEIVRICRCMAELGVHRIKLTGGEPLVRKDCAQLVRMLKAVPGIDVVTLTTNGILLTEQIEDLTSAGLDAVNISLDTLNPELFLKVARRDSLDRVLEGVRAALAHPQLTVKMNCVPVVKNRENFVAMAGLARQYPMHVRFIEMMPIGYGKQFPFQDEASILEILEEAYGTMTPAEGCYGNGPCHYYQAEGFQGKIGFISAVSHKFCSSCNRVRLTAEGFLKGCLQFQEGASLRDILRSGASDEALTEQIRKVIWNKPSGHNFYEAKTACDEVRSMSQIGG
jgi:cyclic pyranopterin phosphate synthase